MSFADTFKALSNPVRREILNLLKKGRLSAGEITSHFDVTGATISNHLKVLREADLIVETKEKNFIYYDLNASVLEEVMVWLADLRQSDNWTDNVQLPDLVRSLRQATIVVVLGHGEDLFPFS